MTVVEHKSDSVLERERSFWDGRYGPVSDEAYTITEATFRDTITPPYQRGGAPSGLTHRRAWDLIQAEGVHGKQILDYACGLGGWGMRLAQLGAECSGFDLSPVGIENARTLARHNDLDVSFDVADARALPYEDASFDICVGIGALHHVVKYGGASFELARVMKPGGLIVFTEVLGHNPLIELARKVTMRGEEDAGDVMLTDALLDGWGAPFAEWKVEPYSLLFMAKKLTRQRLVLRTLYGIDVALLRVCPPLGRYCGECVIVGRA